jgi:hypothetical protein
MMRKFNYVQTKNGRGMVTVVHRITQITEYKLEASAQLDLTTLS